MSAWMMDALIPINAKKICLPGISVFNLCSE